MSKYLELHELDESIKAVENFLKNDTSTFSSVHSETGVKISKVGIKHEIVKPLQNKYYKEVLKQLYKNKAKLIKEIK